MLKDMFELPEFDTGQYIGCEVLMRNGNATLVVLIEELPEVRIDFQKVRWHQYTDLHHCSLDMVRGAFFKLIEVTNSKEKEMFIMAAPAIGTRPYNEIHHYRIFLDETGCHEFLAESVCVNKQKQIAQ